MTGLSRVRQRVTQMKRRRVMAAALCTASFFSGQVLFGAEPLGSHSNAPSLLGVSQKPKATATLGALPASGKSLRPAALEPVQDMALAPASASGKSTPAQLTAASALAAKPDAEGATTEQLAPVVPAWAVPRPNKKPATTAAAQQSAPPRIELRNTEQTTVATLPEARTARPDSLAKATQAKTNEIATKNNFRQVAAPAERQLTGRSLPLLLGAPPSLRTSESLTQRPVSEKEPVAEPASAVAKQPDIAAAPAAINLPNTTTASTSSSTNATAGGAETSSSVAPLEIRNPNYKQLAEKEPAAPPAPQVVAETPPATVQPQTLSQPAAEFPASVGSVEAFSDNRTEVRSAAVAAPAQPADVQKADYESRLAVQPPRPDFFPDREDRLGILPADSPFEAIEQSGTVKLRVRRSILLRTKVDVYRTAIVDDTICDIVQFTPREVSIIGRSVGTTHVTFWLDEAGSAPLTYLVDVQPDPQQIKADENKYELLQNVINEMFPDSKVYLVLVADKLLVKGQAKDSEEAAQIMNIVRAQASGVAYNGGAGLGIAQGAATPVLSSAATGGANAPAYQVINMLRVPGIQQVALKVKIAELNRSAARGFGIDAKAAINFSDSAKSTQLFLASMLNATSTATNGGTAGGTSVVTSFGGQEVNIGLRYLQERGVIRLLSEPTLVTLSGRPATFIAGGEFAVPTIVGSVGLNAVTTDFRAFGAIISFLPTVVDKDRIRLQVAPEFSQINSSLTSANNTPGLNVRAATTTVEMREGQTLAIAGLLEDTYKATTVGDLPGLSVIFGRRDTARSETELIILVTPELVQPMEAEEVPPLPGFDVTEPTGSQFFLHGEIEGNPTQDYRSTVWPRLRRRYGMGGPAMTSGPFGHGQ